MELIFMFITHILKTFEYFAIEGFPEITIEQLPYLAEALAYNFIKIITIYLSGFT
jgi:hypothetical protein